MTDAETQPRHGSQAEGMARVLQDLFTVDLLLPATMIYLFRPMVTAASEGIIEQMLPAEDYAAMAASHPRAARILDVDYPASQLFCFVFCCCCCLESPRYNTTPLPRVG